MGMLIVPSHRQRLLLGTPQAAEMNPSAQGPPTVLNAEEHLVPSWAFLVHNDAGATGNHTLCFLSP